MRELITKIVTGLTLAVVLSLSLWFAARHNPHPVRQPTSATRDSAPSKEASAAVPSTPAVGSPKEPALNPPLPDVATIARGRAVYAAQNCASCHAIAGEGNPRHALDGVGARLDAAALREWSTGSGRAADVLSAATVRRKQRLLALPPDDVNVLIAYLSTLKSEH